MEIEYDRRDDHAVDISSDHESAAAPSQSNNSVADQHTSLMAACDNTGTAAATVTVTTAQNCNEKGKSKSEKASDARLSIASVFPVLLLIIVVTLITVPLAIVLIGTLVPGIIICRLLAYMITSLLQFCRCDDYADLDDEYDTDLGTYRYEFVVWMSQLTGFLVVELLVGLACFRRLSLLNVRVWKWCLIGIIVLVYFGFWLLTHIILHEVREKSSIPSVFCRVHLLPILNGLLGVAGCGFYFLVELLIIKLVPPLRQLKILGLYAHKWIHALVYISIGLNVSRVISASIVAMLQKKHEHDGKFDYNPNKVEKAPREIKSGCRDPSEVLDLMGRACKFIMSRLFRRFDREKCTIYVVIGLRRSINFVLVSIWLLVTWISHFDHQLKPSHHTTWILRVGTGTLICLSICAILWLVKNSIMLWWKYRSIYNKFYDQVLQEGINLYLLGMICGQHLDVLKVGWNGREKKIKQGALDQNNHNNNKDSKVVDGKRKNTEEENIKKGADQNKKNSSTSDINDRDSCKADEKKKHAEEKIKKGADQNNNNNNNNNSSNNDNEVGKEKNKAENRTERRINRVVAKARLTLAVPHKAYYNYNLQMGDEAPQLSIYTIMKMVRYFLRAEDTFKEDINESIEKLRKKWRQAAHPSYDQNAHCTPLTLDHIRDAYGTEISHKDFEDLCSQIKRDGNSAISLQDFERWMERSHNTCYNDVNMIASEQRLAQCLNRVMIAVIIIATIAFWLILVTKSTSSVSLLAAPLALAFIFGDTCANVFKGIIFLYVQQPFCIGDICFINGTLYEVKRISLLETTFLKVETNEVEFYPNSALLSQPIINKTNKKGGLDRNDSIEFILESSSTNEQSTLELIKRIDDYFKNNQFTIFQQPRVEMNCGIRDTGKQNMTLHFKHNLKDFQGVSNSESLREMKRRKEILYHEIMEYCTDLKIRLAKEESH